ncbi:Glutathione import ATP-binding protein GsiA [Tritonibacter multivorans]|uniref:Glutathione import ATP-binding protein GsiA n=1 Tax=Tritonibacter multivorans TaxID=928856 RepID=A0A0P1G235_9RHOB|nr:ABC transporter ATP-binding protein [Tritonibacter multivorans]MDA7419611.1 ABC transporter ATP-binding protein [Tritonibacter multivorans]CUH75820.1 Glutathione import ATP-binding protein GsiA [Tritonibacter multivorans]SFC60481.1 peptide/nickel transport system ATP-binding protein [Tritonibacter multivorans]
MQPLLSVENLSIGFGKSEPVVRDVNFSVSAGETLALVGESGSGKTISCRALLQILPRAAQIRSGRMLFNPNGDPVDLATLSSRKLRHIRGNRIAMIFQEPMRSLSPLHKIGNQVAEALKLHGRISDSDAKRRVLEQFERVGFPNPDRTWRSYPFELSGGMRQRAMIAMAMVAKPDLLIADEPTTALDVTTQAQVLGLMKELQQETGMAMILVTHDLGVVANMAEQVVVMHKGRVMEAGPAAPILRAPAHPYTQKLFHAAPKIPDPVAQDRPVERDLILEMRDVAKTFTMRAGKAWAAPQKVQACAGLDFSLPRGKTLAIVGESGSGKTTAARIALGAEAPDAGGQVLFRPTPDATPVAVHRMDRKQRRAFQREAQMVFQDPYSSLSPRMRILDTLSEPLEIHDIGGASERRDRAGEMLKMVGLPTDMLLRFPHAFSGGQRQRLSIARALMLNPSLLICDEPTSALDVSVQDQILSLLEDIRDAQNLSYLFISHDLAVVARIADEVAVMRRGLVVEQAPPEELFHNPNHPYTKALIAAQPTPDVNRPINLKLVAQGAGSPEHWPEQFRFKGSDAPPLVAMSPDKGSEATASGHKVRCHV